MHKSNPSEKLDIFSISVPGKDKISFIQNLLLPSSECKVLFLETFLESYLRQAVYPSLKKHELIEFLSEEFEKELKKFYDEKSTIWISAVKNNLLIGFIIFDLTQLPSEILIRQIVVNPAAKGCGVGKELIFCAKKLYPQIKRLSLKTHIKNIDAFNFYKAISFKPCKTKQDNPYITLEFEF